ncbi:putative sterol carrier protein [Paenibacillus shirakamiensis]|uniref:Sterol carrier protein n=1 Tax=Paenibacillus shirakamiensis TaxID=1265935 RepID=A0ABS4JBI6_9BACL|nr:SCP2 sterol-binding domain-containing protein [Paenibacillus shirakamiensis]MBP1999077.1 putative sterol carrier protein [Paenibacillus shirakamiensis]
MSIREELAELAAHMTSQPEPIQSLYAIYDFRMKDAEDVQVAFREGSVEVVDGCTYSPDCTLILSEANLRKLLNDELNTTMAFMTGTLKVEGKLGLALKLQEILKNYPRI